MSSNENDERKGGPSAVPTEEKTDSGIFNCSKQKKVLETDRRIQNNEFQQFRARGITRSRSKYFCKLRSCSQSKQLVSLMTSRFRATHDSFNNGATDYAIRF